MAIKPVRWLILLAALPALSGCGDDGPSGPPVPAEVVVSPSHDTLTVTGGTLQFSARPLSKKGKLLTGLSTTWASSSPTVVEVDQTGLATAVGPGVAQILATSSGVVGSASLTVALAPAQTEIVAGDGQTGLVGTILDVPLRIKVTDKAGVPIPGVPVSFSVLEGGGLVFPSQVRTGSDGSAGAQWMLGRHPAEPQRVAASVGSLSTEFQATATWPPLHVLTTTPPNGRITVDYGGQLEVAGGSGAPYGWTVEGGTLPPGLALSPDGELTGTPTEEGRFTFMARVQDSEGTGISQEVVFRVCPAPSHLDPGQFQTLDPAGGDGCGFFIPTGMAGDRYRVGIVRSETNRDAEDVVRVTLDVRGAGVEPGLPPEPTSFPAFVSSFRPSDLAEAEAVSDATEAYHLEIREEERRLLETLPPEFRPLSSFPPNAPEVVAARVQGAPEKLQLRFPENGCDPIFPKTALLLGETEDIGIYQDSVQNLTEPVSTGAVNAMLAYYRDYGKTVIDGYFGGVSDVNGDGRVVVFVAPGIRDGVAGFVRSSDMLGRELCSSSNEMEITYLKASFVNRYDNGGYQLVGTLVHEIKHISSLYRRLVARAFHPTWVEEGTAEIATDRASRLAIAGVGGPGVGDMLTLEDIEAYGLTIEGYNTRLRLSRSLRFLASQPNSVTVNPEGAVFMSATGPQERHTIYGAGWHFHRWLGDAYGGASTSLADTALFRLQNDSLTAPGPDAYPTLVGRTFSELMEEYAVAVMLNGTEAPPPQRAFTSVDFPRAMSSFTVYSEASRPFGVFPWPVTKSSGKGGSIRGTVSLKTATYSGLMGESGLRIHDLTSNGTGQGAEVTVFAPTGSSAVLVRIR